VFFVSFSWSVLAEKSPPPVSSLMIEFSNGVLSGGSLKMTNLFLSKLALSGLAPVFPFSKRI
jgi:hypothetical protein